MDVEVAVDRIADPTALVEHLTAELGPADRVEITELAGGNANETLELRWDGDRYVLRIPPTTSPAPELLAAMDREAAALASAAATDVPAPAVSHRAPASVIGESFLVLEYVPGDVLEGALPDRFDTRSARTQLVDDIVDALAGIHAIDPPAAFADDPATSGGYLTDRLEALRRQLAWAETVTTDTRRVDALHGLLDRVADQRPDPSVDATLVHGDFKPDNILVSPGEDLAVTGILDWEMAGRGDPLADLGWLLSYWSHAADPTYITDEFRATYDDHDFFPIVEVYLEEYTAFTTHPDTPGRGEIVDRYETATGRTYRHDQFYRALGALKLAVICEGFFRVYLEAPAKAKDSYPAMELLPFVLAEQGHRTLDGDVPLRA